MLTHAETVMEDLAVASDVGIVAEGITKRYGHQTALDRVSIGVPSGSVLALLGPNGAGKTTLVRVLTTLIPPDEGRAIVAGHDVVARPGEVRRSIGLVGQHAAVDEYLTGRENLTLVARLLRFGRTEALDRVGAALETFGLADVADAPAATYSGGLRRRLDLAVTLLADPAVLFLDEPTTGLDPASRHGLWALVDELVAGGTTVLLTTQYLEEADRLARSVAVIDHGRVIATGTPDDLRARLGGDTVHIRLADAADLPRAAVALARADPEADPDRNSLEVRASDGAALLPTALRVLDGHGVSVTAAEVRRPSLDDVFLTLTGERTGPTTDDSERAPGPAPRPSRWAHHHGKRSHT
jgi:ABC-2 type transport system ATP-binding protein